MCPTLFVPTRAIRDAKETLKKEGSVFLVGRSGDGKTYSAYHILTELKKQDPSYEIYIVSKPEDMDHIPSRNSIVFVDNIFGASSYSSVLFEKWRACFTYMEGYVKTGHMYFISASQNQVRDECVSELGNVPLLKPIIDMSDEYCLSIKEKEAMLTKFLQHYEVIMTEKDKHTAVRSKLSLGFPQCCKLFVTNPEAQELGPSFFEASFMFLSSQIKKMKSSETDHDKHLYLVLVMGIFERGKISFERFDPFCKSNEFQPSSEELQQVCGIEKRITKDDMVSASNKLCKMGYLRCIEVNALYQFSHQSIYDAVAVLFGKVHTQQIIGLCPLKFLLDHTTVSDGSQVDKKSVIMVQSELLIARLIAELKKGEFSVLEHSALQKELFVTKLFFNEQFSKAVKEQLAEGLLESNVLYYLTASKKYSVFMKRFLEELQKMENYEAVRKGLLHQIFEGSCIAGDLIIFGKLFSLKMITPCQQCIVKAAESPVDHPDIMTKLLSRMSLEYSTMERVVTLLVERGRPNTLRKIPQESITWSFYRGKNKQKHLFTLACLAGNFEIFQLLKKIIGEPYSAQDLLFPAVNGGNMNILESIITEENINCADTHGRTILHHACKKRLDLCEFLIKKGIDPNKKDKKGAQAFHKACQYMDEKSIRHLISLGFKVAVTDDGNNQLSPLHKAASNDKGASLVELLVQACPSDMINFPNTQGQTPLHIASRHLHGRDFINELMNRNADHSLKDMNGMTALHHAAASMNPGNIVALIDCSANVDAVDKEKKTPLHHVLENLIETSDEIEAQRDSVIHLLKKGANVFLADNCGNTAMHVAGLFNTPAETCKTLIEKHVSIDLNNEGFSVLHLMLQSNAPAEVLTFMVETCPELLQINTKYGDSVLHVALSSCLPFDVFRMLIYKIPSAIESVKWKNIDFMWTMLRYKSEEVICFLEQCAEYIPKPIPADLLHFVCVSNMSDESWTRVMDCLKVDKSSLSQDRVQSLLHTVCSSEAKITYLVEKGASVNTKNQIGDTPLHVAAACTSYEGVAALLKAGADINLYNKHNQTALHMAVSNIGLNFQFALDPRGLYSVVDNVDIVPTPMVIKKMHMALQTEEDLLVHGKDRGGPSPVPYRANKKSVLEILVDNGSNLDLTTNDGFTCLHLACLNGDDTSVRCLLRCMSSQQRKEKTCNDMKTMKGVGQTDRDMKILFKEGKDGVLPIHCAVRSGKLVVVKQVAEAMKAAAGKKTGNSSDTRLTKQTKMSKPKGPILRGQGKQVRTKSQEVNSSTTGSERSRTGKTRSTKKLSNSQQQNLQKIMIAHEEKYKNTLLQYAVQFSTVEIMQFLLEEGWELNLADEDDNTLLHYAARWNRKEAIEYLLREKLNVHCFNKEGLMPLHVAMKSSHSQKQCFDLLTRDNSASVTELTRNKKRNLLHLLCKNSPVSLLAYSMHIFDTEARYSLTLMPLPWVLIEKGCDVNGKDVDNMTPLHFAAEANNALLVGILLENKANINAVDIQGRTPLHLALQTSGSSPAFIKYSAALLLAQQGANPHAVVRSGDTPIDILLKMDKHTLEISQDIKEICQLFKIWEDVKPV
ncbi:serine/threonine-protein phosphatase 6 regulatory ankyrin repeat subunit B-like isoform X2 [Haliotis asinina]